MTATLTSPRAAGAGDAGGAHLGVPWPTVLMLAAVAAFGNGFWLIAVRGAIGAIERTTGPFMVWLQESTLLVPVYVFAVLAALTLALRWFGPGPMRFRAVAGTVLLVALASTLAALTVQAVSAVDDYHLQAQHVLNMALHVTTCDAQCVADRQRSALMLQINALGLNAIVMLASNLVLLGLVVAFRGGRLEVATRRRGTGRVSGRIGRFDNVELFLISGLLGVAVIHVAVVGARLAQWPAAGIALLLLTMAEVDVALLFLLRLRSVHYVATAAVSAGPLLVWLYAHTVGLPFGPDAGSVQPIGLTDTVVALLQAATLVVAVMSLRSPGRRRPLGRPTATSQHSVRLAFVGVAAVTIVGVGVGLGAIDGGPQDVTQHHSHHATG